jgi:pyruvate/2-oxoglutarate dehydrogenase complex dihydrolipoamide dehydrogenase (E3) component
MRGTGEEEKDHWLYAVGDINHRALLTHVGKYQARACTNAILAQAKGTFKNDESGEWSRSVAKADSHNIIPQVIFTDPQVASVGLTEQSAKGLGLNTCSVDSEIGSVDGVKLHTDGYVGQARLIIDEDKKIVVGSTFIGPQV